ncbi:Coenzyme F420 hydrogenase/dehydrogenase, beta subunit C-terminal domain [Ruegeria sp. AU67]|uniref:Coenzyme F420 hydrogenase/dehydrogenase, beta subunit C-terminal domain n=1 Tax=Ruegeria sp. AU67 TaxID=2108530 RepID=UPI000D68CF56|nr:Coenzyme F420 hydrogenase/dehydrogenase, beta subunit C-terminal domain [Ruegeria sp. AU67]
MNSKVEVRSIPDPRLCLGCGVCSYIGAEGDVTMIDIDHVGTRPKFSETISSQKTREMLAVCPTVFTDFGELKRRNDYKPVVNKTTENNWGAISGIWEGYATDEEIRFKGSSGGALTAIAQYCLEQRDFHGVLHTGENPEDPIRNKTRMSFDRKELLAVVGSRYSPASVCDGLGQVEAAPNPCVVIGKPVEVAATRNAMKVRPALAEKVGVTLSFFCAETPPTQATRSLMERFGVAESNLKSLRYRGYGWPGYFTTRNGDQPVRERLIYYEAWAYLQKFRPWATHLWPDGSGELADISCGDPWYEQPDGKNPGFSLIVARTKLGKDIVEGAITAGYLTASVAEPWKIGKSQEGLLRKKGSVWGRRLAHRILGMPNTQFKELDLFSPWRALPLKVKLQSTIGTLRRILQRGMWRAP